MTNTILAVGSISNYVALGCKQDNMSCTHLLRGLFLGEYFKEYIFLNLQKKFKNQNICNFQKNQSLFMSF
jgi:hypothetical protein